MESGLTYQLTDGGPSVTPDFPTGVSEVPFGAAPGWPLCGTDRWLRSTNVMVFWYLRAIELSSWFAFMSLSLRKTWFSPFIRTQLPKRQAGSRLGDSAFLEGISA